MSGWSPSEEERHQAKEAKREREFQRLNPIVGPPCDPSQRCFAFTAVGIVTTVLICAALFCIYVRYFS
jgi:hypothetical protein